MAPQSAEFDYEKALFLGRSLFHAHEILLERLDHALPVDRFEDDTTEVYGCTFGAVILSAFELEVQIKGLLMKYKKLSIDNHELKRLYDQLPRDLKTDTEKFYCAISGIQNLDSEHDSYYLTSLLRKIDNLFTEWRYFYEGDEVSSSYDQRIKYLHNFLTYADSIKCHKDDS